MSSPVNDEGGGEAARLVHDAGGAAEQICCDVRRPDEITAAMRRTAERFRGIDVLHNNARVHESDVTDQLARLDEIEDPCLRAVPEPLRTARGELSR